MKAVEHRLEDMGGAHEGLTFCTVCKAAEGELLTHCPGHELNSEALEACYNGNVIDMHRWRMRHYYRSKP